MSAKLFNYLGGLSKFCDVAQVKTLARNIIDLEISQFASDLTNKFIRRSLCGEETCFVTRISWNECAGCAYYSLVALLLTSNKI
jgi:hypothetical protein